jgi:hypothetical protein
MAADRQHLHHRLLNIGHSYRQSVLIMYLWAALFSVTVVSLSLVRTPSVVFIAATLVAVLALLPVTMPRFRPWRARPPAKPRPARPSAPIPPAPVPPAYAPAAQVSHAPAAPSATAPSATAPSAPVPPVHAAAASVPDVPRFLPAAPSNGTNGASSNGATLPGTGGFAGQARYQGQDQARYRGQDQAHYQEQEPFPRPPVPNGQPAAPWEQVSPNRPAPWQDAYGDQDAAAAPQGPFPGQDAYGDRDAAAPRGPLSGQDGFSGPGPYTGGSPVPGQPEPQDGALDGNDPFSQVQYPDAWPR